MNCSNKANILKKTLINNAIALAVCGITSAAALFIEDNITYPISGKVNPFVVMACIAALLYVLCGFFLIPVKKRSYLSVISVAIGMIITFIICMLLGDDGLEYYLLNPIALPLLGFEIPELLQFPMVLLSPLYPFILMYLGMLIRKVAIKKKGNP